MKNFESKYMNFISAGEPVIGIIVFQYGDTVKYHRVCWETTKRSSATGVWRVKYKNK